MHHPLRAFVNLACLGLAAATGSAAWGQERLLMPFSCDARGAQVRLTPAPQQSYRIYGAHEKWLFRTCSPHSPDRCHNWMLHRFDVDCGGISVPWVQVAEASVPSSRAWVEGGRMTLQLDAGWASPREERMARRRWWRQPREPYPFNDRERFDGPTNAVEFPEGFAPVLGTRAQFLGAPPPETSSAPLEDDPELAQAETETPVKTAPSASPKREPLHAEAQKPAVATPTQPPPPAPAKRETDKVAAQTAQPKEQAAPKEQPAPKTEAKPVAAPVKDEQGPATAAAPTHAPQGTPAMPTIINKPQGSGPAPASVPDPATRAPQALESSAPSERAEDAGAGPQTETGGMPQEVSPASPTASPIATGSLRDGGAKSGPLALLTNPIAATALALLGVVLAASSFVVWSRRQERVQIGARVRRDIASVSFGGAEVRAHPSVALKAHMPGATTVTLAPETAAPAHGDAGALPMPETPAEALQVLGASPDAAIEVIKKIVDGLRQSWHPDLARSEDDRRYREQRMRQINVAWDIISGQRSAA